MIFTTFLRINWINPGFFLEKWSKLKCATLQATIHPLLDYKKYVIHQNLTFSTSSHSECCRWRGSAALVWRTVEVTCCAWYVCYYRVIHFRFVINNEVISFFGGECFTIILVWPSSIGMKNQIKLHIISVPLTHDLEFLGRVGSAWFPQLIALQGQYRISFLPGIRQPHCLVFSNLLAGEQATQLHTNKIIDMTILGSPGCVLLWKRTHI